MKTHAFIEFTARLPSSFSFFSRDAGSLPCLPSLGRLASWETLPKRELQTWFVLLQLEPAGAVPAPGALPVVFPTGTGVR